MLIYLLKLFFNCLTAALVTLALLCLLVLDTTPNLPLNWSPNAQLSNELFKKTAAQAQNSENLTLSEQELNHALNSIINRFITSVTKIQFLADNHLQLVSALQYNKHVDFCFVNLSLKLVNQGGGLSIKELQIGKLKFRTQAAGFIFKTLLQHSVLKHYYFLAQQHIKAVYIENNALQINYTFNSMAQTDSDLSAVKPSNCRAPCNQPKPLAAPLLITQPETLEFYHQQINLIVQHHNPEQRLSLASLLQPLFKLAWQRSTPATAISDNIAIIYAICAYVNRNEIPFYLPITQPLTQIHSYPVYLYKRTDQAKHFMLSAALTVSGGPHLADLLGQEKELRDAFSSSGFSFIDLAADRAGMKFSERATASAKDAKELQAIMAGITDYHSFMPVTQDLPEKLNNAQFTQQFDSITSPAYRQLLQKIDNRIEALPIYPQKTG